MTINEMRKYVLDYYPNATPLFRELIATGPTRRVVAIYKSIKEREENGILVNSSSPYHQMDMFEYMVTLNNNGNTTEVMV